MHKKIAKAITGSLTAAAMLATSAMTLIPMSASAGQQLGRTDFEEGAGLPWHTCETNPAKQHFDIDGDTYNVHIDNEKGLEGRWDLQLRHRGLHIESGHKYTISWEFTADTDGWIYAKIGNYAGKIEVWHNISGQAWQPLQVKAGETVKGTDTFTADQTLDVAEWAFHYANHVGTAGGNEHGGSDTGFKKGSTISFKSLSLVDETSDEWDFDKTNEFGVVRPQSNVRLNQVGYYSNLNKKASYVTDASEPLEFEVQDSSGKKVWGGKTTVFGADPDSGTSKTEDIKVGDETRTKYKDTGANVHIIDFSEFTEPGKYTIFVKDSTGIKGTQSGKTKGAYDTTIKGDEVIWKNWVTEKDYVVNRSFEFEISNDVYKGLLADAMNYYYQNRSGVPIEEKYITSCNPKDTEPDADGHTGKAKLAHSQYGHGTDTANVQPDWVKAYMSTDEIKTKYSIDGTGGWYDAGDHGKYVVNGGVSVWTLQNAFEFSKHIGKDAKWTEDAMKVPEGGDKVPDILDEARVELDWMFKMTATSDDPYYDAGMVYHKLHDYKWTGLGIHAWKYEGFEDIKKYRIVKPATYAATFNMIACAAQASRLWADYDASYAKTCLENAQKSWDVIYKMKDSWNVKEGKAKTDENPSGDIYFAPLDQAIGGGAYGDSYVADDAYWAACELFATTGDTSADYYDFMQEYKNPNDSTGNDKAFSLTSNLGGGENKGSLSSFNWGCTSGLGTLSLYLNSKKLTDAQAKSVKDSIAKAADVYIKEEAAQGMGIPYHGARFTDPINIGDEVVTGYEWGSNSFVINNAIVMAYAYDSTGQKKYINGASEAMDYIFGRNGLCFSYVTGYGDVTLTYPHHRFWAYGISPEFPMAPNGILSGGPGAGMQDPYIGGLGYKRGTLASQKCYVDSAESWSTNEVTINWNAPLAWMASFMDDVAPTAGDIEPTSDESSSNKKIVWGDANCDGDVNMPDVVLIMQDALNPGKYGIKGTDTENRITADGEINADVESNGNGIDLKDALLVQQYTLKLVSDLTPAGKK